ncbi:MAG: sigma-54-dependent transcriptional regulator [Nitrospirota bacterium]
MKSILIVDDESGVRESIRMILKKEYLTLMAANGEDAINLFKEEHPNLVLLDIIMPDIDGIEVLKKLREINKSIPVIMVTAVQMVKTAVEAMKSGAADYITKPFDIDELKLAVSRTLATQELEKDVKYLLSELIKRYNIVGKSKLMMDVYSRIHQIADTKTTVLILGESGTGKELAARALHYNSSRCHKPFVLVNCAAIPESLIESELFGHEKGAFTDAHIRREGQFEAANNGSLFLDEIGDLSLATQAKLLRVIQEREFARVGGTKTIKVDVRLITATNKNLEEAMRDGRFREDLYYRINVVPIYLPSLRERTEDIPLLVKYFLKKNAEEEGKMLKEISQNAMDFLVRYQWPGNVRELENIIEQIVVLSSNDKIMTDDLPIHIKSQTVSRALKEKTLSGRISFERAVMEFEKEIIFETLKRANYIQTHAANLLSISRRMLKYKMDNLGITLTRDGVSIARKRQTKL